MKERRRREKKNFFGRWDFFSVLFHSGRCDKIRI